MINAGYTIVKEKPEPGEREIKLISIYMDDSVTLRQLFVVATILFRAGTFKILFEEFLSWVKYGLIQNPIHGFLYILDHVFLWPFYCMKAYLRRNKHVSGFKYEVTLP